MTALSDVDLQRALEELPGWSVQGGEVVKEYRFGDFRAAVAFINRIADLAEAADHHPNLENHYNRVKVALFTWSEKAITDEDVAMARDIEAVATAP